MTDKELTLSELEKIMQAIPNREPGITEIKIIPSEVMTQGIGILMLHPVDYEAYTKKLKP